MGSGGNTSQSIQTRRMGTGGYSLSFKEVDIFTESEFFVGGRE